MSGISQWVRYEEVFVIIIDYTNYKGVRARRRITPKRWSFKSTEQHPVTQWILDAWDLDKEELRSFALTNIHSWEQI